MGTPKEVALKLTNPSSLLWNWFEFVFRCQFNYIWIVGVTIWSGEVNIFYFLAKHHIILSGANSLGLISWDLLHWCNQHQKGVRSINLDIDIRSIVSCNLRNMCSPNHTLLDLCFCTALTNTVHKASVFTVLQGARDLSEILVLYCCLLYSCALRH